jgi:hypothetical protein
MKKLIISPQAGLGNRLRALCSAKLLGRFLDREVFHYWVKDRNTSSADHVNQMKGIDPSYLFEFGIPLFDGSAVDDCFSEWKSGDNWYATQSTAQSKLQCASTRKLSDIQEIVDCESDTILIETSLELRLPNFSDSWAAMMTEVYKAYFPLNARWAAYCDHAPVFDIGFAIRRGDFVALFPHAYISPEKAAEAIARFDGSKIIFSDDGKYLEELMEHLNSPLGMHAGRHDLSGLDRTFYEFMVLSKCRKVVGTEGSSFARQAAIYGGTAYETLEVTGEVPPLHI